MTNTSSAAQLDAATIKHCLDLASKFMDPLLWEGYRQTLLQQHLQLQIKATFAIANARVTPVAQLPAKYAAEARLQKLEQQLASL